MDSVKVTLEAALQNKTSNSSELRGIERKSEFRELRIGYTDYWGTKFEPTALGGVTMWRELCNRLRNRQTGRFRYINHSFDNVVRSTIDWNQCDAVLSLVGQYGFLYYSSRDRPLQILRDCATVGWWGQILQELLCAPLSGPSDFVMFPSQYAMSTYRRILSDTVPMTIAAGIELPSRETVEKHKRERQSDVVTLCHLGRLSYDKNIVTTVRAFLRIRKSGRKVRLVLIGPTVPEGFGPDLTLLRAVAMKAGASDDLEFLGYVPDEVKWRALSQSDILVFPATSAHESLCRTVVEAKHCGLAVVSTRFGPIPGLIKDGETGLLVDVKRTASEILLSGGHTVSLEFEQLVDAIISLIDNPEVLKKLKHIPEDIIKPYSMESFLSKIEDLLVPTDRLKQVDLHRPLKDHSEVFKKEFLDFIDTDISLSELLKLTARHTLSMYDKGQLLLGGCPTPESLGIKLKAGLGEYLFSTS